MKAVLIVLLVFIANVCKATESVLVFTKTEGFRHESIEIGVQTIKELGSQKDFKVTHTENSEVFSNENLKQYDLVIFLNTTGDVLNEVEEEAFENYIKKGGSFMGIHSASDTEFNWPWYGELVGAYFLDHPKQSEATIKRIIKNHITKHLPKKWTRFDEWYNFKWISKNIHVLLALDESSYEGGKNGHFHPIAWYQEFDGGRSFYTGLGHTIESYKEPDFKQHILDGILYCLDREL